MQDVEKRLKAAEAECKRLKIENENLKQLLKQHHKSVNESSPVYHQASKASDTAKEQKTNERIEIFRGLFKGRTDVYDVSWGSKTGKSGYSPACLDEWDPKLCRKPKIKYDDCRLDRPVVFLLGDSSCIIVSLLMASLSFFYVS